MPDDVPAVMMVTAGVVVNGEYRSGYTVIVNAVPLLVPLSAVLFLLVSATAVAVTVTVRPVAGADAGAV